MARVLVYAVNTEGFDRPARSARRLIEHAVARARQPAQARTAVVLSDDGVNPHTVENSLRKAYTAFTTRTPTVEMAKRTQPALGSFLLLANMSALDGGMPIFAANKELVGAIGISGAPGGEKDTACAQVGLDKIAGRL